MLEAIEELEELEEEEEEFAIGAPSVVVPPVAEVPPPEPLSVETPMAAAQTPESLAPAPATEPSSFAPPLAATVAATAPEAPMEPSVPLPPPSGAAPRFAPAPPAVVLPMSRSPIRPEVPPIVTSNGVSGLDRLLRMAAARGASTLYLSSNARPSVRVDGEIQMLEGEPSLGPNDVESLLLTLMPERNHETLRSGLATEWITDLEGVGRVRCMSFRDHRGPGGVFRMMPVRAVTAEQLGLPRSVQTLAVEREGLVLVAGPRLSGKRTLISAFVDLINHARRDHVVTVEGEINVVHERGTSFISQREVRGGYDETLAVARAALREDPDVLVVESLRTAALINVALEAAASGQLVIGGFPAHSATATIDRIINLYPPEHRRQVQLALAENLRGVVAQVLLQKSGGGRLAAREVMLNTPAVASVIAEGRTSQLPLAIEGGRRQGMVPLNDALVGLVQSGSVDVCEAYRHAADRPGFVALLNRMGIDTSSLERLA
jgi:twitching motility protein PilT